jgi:hypothetical protein
MRLLCSLGVLLPNFDRLVCLASNQAAGGTKKHRATDSDGGTIYERQSSTQLANMVRSAKSCTVILVLITSSIRVDESN